MGFYERQFGILYNYVTRSNISQYRNDYKNERSGVTNAPTLQEFLFCKIKRQSVFQRQRDINSNTISVHL